MAMKYMNKDEYLDMNITAVLSKWRICDEYCVLVIVTCWQSGEYVANINDIRHIFAQSSGEYGVLIIS